jgi:hypothetical protein
MRWQQKHVSECQQDSLACKFSDLMFHGDISGPVNMSSSEGTSSALHVGDNIIDSGNDELSAMFDLLNKNLLLLVIFITMFLLILTLFLLKSTQLFLLLLHGCLESALMFKLNRHFKLFLMRYYMMLLQIEKRRLDVVGDGLWGSHYECFYFGIFNHFACSNHQPNQKAVIL